MTAVDQTPPFKSIMLPIDHQETVPEVVKFAARVAGTYDTTLTLLFAPELPGRSSGTGFVAETADESAQRINQLIAYEIKPLLGDTAIDNVVIRAGKAADVIVSVANEMEIDVVVMGSRGKTGLAHLLMGSVTERVVPLCNRPVMTYPVR